MSHQHPYNNYKDFPASRQIVEKIRFLDVRPKDFAGCASVDEEFTVILRKSGDLKASCRPTEPGFAGRIREINRAHRSLKELYEDGVIDSFSEFLRPKQVKNDDDESQSGQDSEGQEYERQGRKESNNV